MRVIILMSVISMNVMSFQDSRHAAAEEQGNDETQSELAKFQGLWHSSPGGMEHRGGKQVVRNPAVDGPCFFVCGSRLIWLDAMGKPTGEEQAIALDVRAEPKRFTLAHAGGKQDKPSFHGIYVATDSSLTIHVGLDGGPAPKQFLVLNKPEKGVDGEEWLVGRIKLREK